MSLKKTLGIGFLLKYDFFDNRQVFSQKNDILFLSQKRKKLIYEFNSDITQQGGYTHEHVL